MSRPKDIADCLPKDSWFKDYMAVWPLAEPPRSYILFAAMAMFGAALGRRVYFGQDFRKLWPMLNMLLIGQSGLGKSTSIEMAQPLLYTLPKIEQPQFIVGGATPEKLHADLLPNPHAVLFASELANFFNKQDYNAALIPYVTELLDYKPVEKRSKSGGLIRIEEPSVAVVGGSTVEWLQDQLPDTAVSGGFLARFLIIEEDTKARKVASPEDAISYKALKELQQKREEVFLRFAPLVLGSEGKIAFKDYGALDVYTIWYSSHSPINGHLAPFAARAPEFIKRLALILTCSANRTAISEEDIDAAIQLYSYCETKLQKVVVPMSQDGKMLGKVLEAIGNNPKTEAEILQAMRNFADAKKVQNWLNSLMQSQDIVYYDGKFKRK